MKFIACILILLYSSVVSYFAYKYVASFLLFINPKLEDTGPLIILFYIVLNLVYVLVLSPLRLITKKAKLLLDDGFVLLSVFVSALLIACPTTVKIIMSFHELSKSDYTGGGFVGLGYVIFCGISLFFCTVISIPAKT